MSETITWLKVKVPSWNEGATIRDVLQQLGLYAMVEEEEIGETDTETGG